MERSPADHASASELPALLIKGPREVALITRDQEAFSTPAAGPSGSAGKELFSLKLSPHASENEEAHRTSHTAQE